MRDLVDSAQVWLTVDDKMMHLDEIIFHHPKGIDVHIIDRRNLM